ncbi:MAG: alpha/beta hydrolase [Blastochloris sp.]|nr:alpha/beta hydrolase [Blastochloris sp.]
MRTIQLYEDMAPLSQGNSAQDNPTLDIYEPFGEIFPDAAVILLPGGGYAGLSSQEGEGMAGVFQLWGLKAFVCNYRLGSAGYRHPTMLLDAARAVRLVRAHAKEWGIHPDKIVLVGCSAGGHLAATLLTKWDAGQHNHSDPVERVSSRPDLGVLCYPVITMSKTTHGGSRNNLLGENPSQELIEETSAERHVSPLTPPCFIWHTYEDDSVSVDNALLFTHALQKSSVPFELHVYQDGGHGLGMKNGHSWANDCLNWLCKRLK